MKKLVLIGIFTILLAMVFFACDNGNGNGDHTHSYGTAWKSNETQHWHECSCGDKKDIANHTFVADICSVCNYERDHTHSYGTAWKSNETQHWHECSCGDKK